MLRFQLVKKKRKQNEGGEAHGPTDEEEETALRYTVKQHSTSSHMHHSVTGFPPSKWTKGHWSTHTQLNKLKLLRCHISDQLTAKKQKKDKKKSLCTINVIKWQLMQLLHVEWSGITLTCSDRRSAIVRVQFSVLGGEERDEKETMDIICETLCWAY